MFDELRAYISNHTEVSSEDRKRVQQLEQIINISTNNPFLFVRALRHRSTVGMQAHGPLNSYERLEFLGDAVLDLIVSEIIFDRYPGENEGFLTKLRAQLVKGEALADYAQKLGLASVIIVGKRARGQGIEFSKSALSDVFESLIGAIYIDNGYKQAASFVSRVMHNFVNFDKLINSLDNYKSLLLEYAQAAKMEIPRYEVIGEMGPGHDKTFKVVAIVDDKKECRGIGKSKKEAEQKAARKTLRLLRSRE